MKIEDYGGLLISVYQEWDKAETVIKLAEQVSGKIVFPSINELRYAGRRISEALSCIARGDDPKKIEALLRDAQFDCLRARHDAIDASTSKIAADIDVMSQKLRYEAILVAFPRFADLSRNLRDVRKKIVQSRGDRDNRDKIYAVISAADLPKLVDEYNALRDAEPIMRSMARRQRVERVLTRFALAIALLALAVETWNLVAG
jgi:hypothetical protein